MRTQSTLTRREFIKITNNILFGLSGLLGLGGLVRYFSYQFDPGPPGEYDLGDISNFPDGSRTIRADIPAVIENRAGALIAFSLTCTHLGCTVEMDDKIFACPCHGSRYDADGKVLKGPAQKPLRKLRITVQPDNTLKLYTDEGKP